MKKQLLLFVWGALFFGINNSQGQQAILWQKSLGGIGEDYARSVSSTFDGGFIVAGSSTSNDGDVTGNHGGFDYWVTKLSSMGIIEWQKSLGGTLGELAYSVIQSSDSGYVLAGYTLSNDGDVSGNHGDKDFWVIKVDSTGNLIWQICLGGTGDEEAYSVIECFDGGYAVIGSSYSVGPSYGGYDYWLVKLSAMGVMQWQKCLGGANSDIGRTVTQTADSGYFVGGYSYSNTGLVSNNYGQGDYWVAKLNGSGNLQWEENFGGSGDDILYRVHQTNDGGYILGGYSWSTNHDVTGNHGGGDFWAVKINSAGVLEYQQCFGGTGFEDAWDILKTTDGGYMLSGSSNLNNGDVTGHHGGTYDYWIVKTDNTLNLEWQKCLGGTGSEKSYSIVQTNDGYVIAGMSNSIDGDVNGNHGLNDFWIVKIIEEFNDITGKVFGDFNSNGIYDIGDTLISNLKITESQTGYLAFSKTNGYYDLVVPDSGNYSVSVDNQYLYYTGVPAAHSAYFPATFMTDSLNDFALQPDSAINDLCVVLSPTTLFRSGMHAGYSINYKNVGTTIINNVSVIFFPDVNSVYDTSNIPPISIFPDSVVWNIGTLSPFQSGTIIVDVYIIQGLPVGTLINSGVCLEPVTGDANPSCNTSYHEEFIIASSDPNNISVDRSELLTTEFPNPPFLDYIIQFQNVGNDTAFNVVIENTLPENALAGTFELVASSHSVQLEYDNSSSLMTYRFDNILLPDSVVNEFASHGFVRYRIKPEPNLVLGNIISNNASIYFDFNLPVLTNTVITEVVAPTSVDELSIYSNKLLVFPNPAGEYVMVQAPFVVSKPGSVFDKITIYDLAGKSLQVWKSGASPQKLDVNDLTSGIYVIEVIAGEVICRNRFVKK